MDVQPRVTPYLSLSQTTSVTLLSTLSHKEWSSGSSDENGSRSSSSSSPSFPIFSLDRTTTDLPLPLQSLIILLHGEQEDTLPLILPLVNPLHLVVERLSSTPDLPSSSDLACRAAFPLPPNWNRLSSVGMISCLFLSSGGTRTLFPGTSNPRVETLVDFSRWGEEGRQESLDRVATAIQAVRFVTWELAEEERAEGRKSFRFLIGDDAWKTWLEYELGLLELGEETMAQIEVVTKSNGP